MNHIFTVFSFIFGATVGSFCNVCIYRLPRNESVVFPVSHCTACSKAIAWHDNIPVISYLLLKGRCRNCGKSIHWRYPFVEILTGATFLVTYVTFGLQIFSGIYAVFFASLIVISMIDLEHKIIPDVISLPGMIGGLLCSIFFLPIGIVNSLIGLLLGGGLFYAIAVISRGGMGGGDIKLIAMIGSFIGWQKTLLTIFLSALIGSTVGIILMILKKKGRKDMIPYGPFIALGAVISVFFGEHIIYWYLSLGTGRGAAWH